MTLCFVSWRTFFDVWCRATQRCEFGVCGWRGFVAVWHLGQWDLAHHFAVPAHGGSALDRLHAVQPRTLRQRFLRPIVWHWQAEQRQHRQVWAADAHQHDVRRQAVQRRRVVRVSAARSLSAGPTARHKAHAAIARLHVARLVHNQKIDHSRLPDCDNGWVQLRRPNSVRSRRQSIALFLPLMTVVDEQKIGSSVCNLSR